MNVLYSLLSVYTLFYSYFYRVYSKIYVQSLTRLRQLSEMPIELKCSSAAHKQYRRVCANQMCIVGILTVGVQRSPQHGQTTRTDRQSDWGHPQRTYQRYAQPAITRIQYGKRNRVRLEALEQNLSETCLLIVCTYCGHTLYCLRQMRYDRRIGQVLDALQFAADGKIRL